MAASSHSTRGPERARQGGARRGGLLSKLLVASRAVIVVAAFGYPAALALGLLVVGSFAESWWLATVGLYVPRQPFLLPAPFLLVGLWLTGRIRLWWTQLLGVTLAVFPWMGLVLPSYSPSDDAQPKLRIMSFNVDSAYAGEAKILDAIRVRSPDLVFLQETKADTDSISAKLQKRFPFVSVQPRSVVASKYPIVETSAQHGVRHEGGMRSQRYQRHVIRTPLGAIAIYNVHPISPRGALNMHRFRGAFSMLRRGQAINDQSLAELASNTELRKIQIQAVGAEARAEHLPVIVAGDFNLPTLSPTFQSSLGELQDGFRAAGSGFGYTYPTKLPWMRLDRIMTSYDFTFLSFDVDCKGLSDHLCIVAELQKR